MAELVFIHLPVLHAEGQDVDAGVNLMSERLSVPMVRTAAVGASELSGSYQVIVHRLARLIAIGNGKSSELCKDGFEQLLAQLLASVNDLIRSLWIVAHASRGRSCAKQEVAKDEVGGESCTTELVVLGSLAA